MINYYVGASAEKNKDGDSVCGYCIMRVEDGKDEKLIKVGHREAKYNGIEMQTIAFQIALAGIDDKEDAVIYTCCKPLEGAINSGWKHEYLPDIWGKIFGLLKRKTVEVMFLSKNDNANMMVVSDKAKDEALNYVKV